MEYADIVLLRNEVTAVLNGLYVLKRGERVLIRSCGGSCQVSPWLSSIRSRQFSKLRNPWAARRVVSMTRLTASAGPLEVRSVSK